MAGGGGGVNGSFLLMTPFTKAWHKKNEDLDKKKKITRKDTSNKRFGHAKNICENNVF